jgi:beta-galactosidase
VKFEPGEIKAVSYAGGKEHATQSKRTAGKPTALRMTPITGPGGLFATGSDFVLIDVEAIDANGQRCPTFEQRVDFDTTGPGVWRGGYNSGKIKSTNNPQLYLEAGINRVSVRSTRERGTITVTAKAEGLQPATVKITSQPVEVQDAMMAKLPAMPKVALPSERPTSVAQAGGPGAGKGAAQTGKFTANFNYTGPTSGATVQQDAQDGKAVYSDAAAKFETLPAALKGADWLQLPNADRRYSAEDLIELQVKAGSTVYVAHDARLTPPAWLTGKFKPAAADAKITIEGQPMRLFERRIERDESLTFSSNTEDPKAACNMYVVFIAGNRP